MPTALPEIVLRALARGEKIEAIKRLRETTGLGLKEAKDVIDAQTRETGARSSPATTSGRLPENVIAALTRGEKIEAIRRLRKATGLGLKDARDAIESARIRPRRRAPVEVPKSGNTAWFAAYLIVAIAGIVAYHFLRGGG
ncbi:MAG: ribosomal protein L7/L12 [Candidatus Accumulibacter sp.]|jgi:ribosomal protein L7/L12|nr:ribosomal protein L7/L12 [Accumulibacter sp.]